ncbi:MAG: vitamin B12 dependent-methionine synthase activation domain-containing protein [Hungatella sp.]
MESRRGDQMEMNQKEILRYLGYGGQEADEQVLSLVRECYRELKRLTIPKSISRSYPLRLFDGDGVDMTCFQTHSQHLYKNLRDCEQILLFAATLGTAADMLIQKYTKLQMSKAVILQAAATAMLEDYCDEEYEKMRASYEAQGFYLRPRFSPGYGDFPLECQPALIGALETGKRIGITLTDSLLMAPSKSVTAVIGVSRIARTCTAKGCEVCAKQDCIYRRG